MFITAAAPNKRSLGATNGLGQTLVSIGRIVTPVMTTSLLSLSIEHHIMWGFAAYVALIALTMGGLMDTNRKVTGVDTKLTWIDEDFLAAKLKPEEMNFAPWGPMRGEEAGGSLTGISHSLKEGLTSRPLDDIVRDTLAWHETRPADRKATLRSGFTPEKEAEILVAWRAKGDAPL